MTVLDREPLAYAAARQLDRAATAAQQALEIAASTNQPELVRQIRARLSQIQSPSGETRGASR